MTAHSKSLSNKEQPKFSMFVILWKKTQNINNMLIPVKAAI